MRRLLFALLIPCVLIIGCVNTTTPASKPSCLSVPAASFYYELFGSGKTDLQQDRYFDTYKGKCVEWGAYVKSIDTDMFGTYVILLTLRPPGPFTIKSDIVVRMKDGQEDKLSQYSIGDSIYFRGKLDSYGGLIGDDITVTDAEVISPPSYANTATTGEPNPVVTQNTDSNTTTPTTISNDVTAPPRTIELSKAPINIIVEANKPWVDTHIDVKQGTKISIHATGIVKIAGSDTGQIPSGFDPSQSGADRAQLLCPYTSMNYMLVGKVGTGNCFEIGAEKNVTIQKDGRLYLGVNDGTNSFDDNSGSWTVTISTQN